LLESVLNRTLDFISDSFVLELDIGWKMFTPCRHRWYKGKTSCL